MNSRIQSSSVVWISIFLLMSTLSLNSVVAQTKASRNIFKLDDPENPGKGSISNVQWLAGHWQGTGLGGEVDEVWSHPKSGHMSGLFRAFKDDKLRFSEYFTIEQDNGSLALYLLHFNKKLMGWEQKGKPIVFRLVKVEEKAVYFDGMTYRLTKDGSLNVFVLMKKKDGTTSELSFNMKRQNKSGKN